MRDEINKEIAAITKKSEELNDLSKNLKDEEKAINSQIEGSNLKLNFHKEQDQKIIDEAQNEMNAIFKKNSLA